jgi:hypothetical protein
MYDPFATGAILSYFGGKAGAKSALNVADIVSGGQIATIKQWSSKLDGSGGPAVTRGGSTATESRRYLKEESIKDALGSAFESAQARRMRKAAQTVVQNTLNQVVVQAQKVANARSLQQLPVPVPTDATAKLAALPEDQRSEAEAQMVNNIKQAVIKMYATNLQAQLNAAKQAGVPDSSAYVRDYSAALKRISTIA